MQARISKLKYTYVTPGGAHPLVPLGPQPAYLSGR